MQHKRLLIVFFVTVFSFQMADAAYVTALLGPKAESYTSPLAKRSRSNPISLFLSLDFKLKPSWYLSLGASGEFDLGDVATTGFTLAAFVKYFVIGSPDLVSTSGKDARIQLALPYSIFTGVGLFQKDVKFANDRTLENVDTSLGGLGLVVGGTYNLNQKYFLVSQAQYLASGLSSTTTYTSMEFYGGAGFRF